MTLTLFRLISVEKVKLELMSRGEWKVLVQKTMRELCDGPNADDLWLKCINIDN